MGIFNIGVATENNDYEIDTHDQIWILSENGQLVFMEDSEHEND